jgi:hypothetical protein
MRTPQPRSNRSDEGAARPSQFRPLIRPRTNSLLSHLPHPSRSAVIILGFVNPENSPLPGKARQDALLRHEAKPVVG